MAVAGRAIEILWLLSSISDAAEINEKRIDGQYLFNRYVMVSGES
jgi:hypothetical protein